MRYVKCTHIDSTKYICKYGWIVVFVVNFNPIFSPPRRNFKREQKTIKRKKKYICKKATDRLKRKTQNKMVFFYVVRSPTSWLQKFSRFDFLLILWFVVENKIKKKNIKKIIDLPFCLRILYYNGRNMYVCMYIKLKISKFDLLKCKTAKFWQLFAVTIL